MDILKKLQEEFNIKDFQAENTVRLIDEGNTIPFIARYRKELTGSLDDQIIRSIHDRLMYLRGLDDKRNQIIKTIEEQGNMTPEILEKIENAETVTELDDIYRPFRPKRRTRATVAKEKGLDGLADIILGQKLLMSLDDHAKMFIDSEKGVNTISEAIDGAKDIIAEKISDDADIRKVLRTEALKTGFISSKATDSESQSVYEMYYDYSEPVKSIAGHRILAINRGEKEGVLSASISVDNDRFLNIISKNIIIKNSQTEDVLKSTIEDSFKRLIFPSIEREIRNELTERAEEKAMKVFNENLKQLLLQPPIKDKVVMALDPGYKAGCKIAIIDQTGKTLDTTVIYFTVNPKKTEIEKEELKSLIDKYNVDIIAVGNGTASRESELFVVDMIKEIDKEIYYIIVNEAGASVYSASKLGAEEFPDMDVALRSAVSIGRRLQDPLAELVKIDPKSIGVGQYQHDMNQKKLSEELSGVVEDCVNSVGVDLNTASPSLLSYVSGISSAVSKNIQKYREENGKFKSRKELLKVPKLGPKAFEQCAGFLRIPESDMVLDNTGVHPESYKATEELLAMLGYTLDDVKNKNIQGIGEKVGNKTEVAEKLGIGVPTLNDIIRELEKPGRDPREEMPAPVLRSDVLEMSDLKEGMVLKGTVRNVIDFGVFVDIGVHQDGLVHISEISEGYIKHPLDAVSVGDVVDVKVLGVDLKKKRVSLTMKGLKA
ncbi:MAG: RNA-binding transcriptional accessory protein [Tyzzerella sp.]|uniref:RNA-binding transcriptional accessory protein n=1 Tax=Candidatus Fimicola merdigallinarum TaxID=2840819 RepID=A0A9D9DY53_9FIRM|nr:RNA-binding transcriptional accessory protein [Candidatus Fimicola merdigallinarum]